MKSHAHVPLAPPGAGLPAPELLIARRLVPRVTGALAEVDRYLGGAGFAVPARGQQSLF